MGGPIISVELKPKWGFLPSSQHIPPSKAIKRSVCRFCMHQKYKVAHGQLQALSAYCPMDLYSTDPQRVRRGTFGAEKFSSADIPAALRALLDCPHSYFRVLFNGTLVDPAAMSDVLVRALGRGEGVDGAIDALANLLVADGFLLALANAQRVLGTECLVLCFYKLTGV